MNPSRGSHVLLCGVVALMVAAGAYGQEIAPSSLYPSFESIDVDIFDQDWIADSSAGAGAAGVTVESDSRGGIVVTLPSGAFRESQRIAVRPADPVVLDGRVRTITATVDATEAGAVQFRVIVHDGFGIEYKIPTSLRGLPLGEFHASVVLPLFVYQDPLRDRHIQFAGFELVPMSAPQNAVAVRFSAVEVLAELRGSDPDAPEKW